MAQVLVWLLPTTDKLIFWNRSRWSPPSNFYNIKKQIWTNANENRFISIIKVNFFSEKLFKEEINPIRSQWRWKFHVIEKRLNQLTLIEKTLLRGNKLYMTPKLRKTVMKRFKSKSYSNNSGTIADQSAYKKLIKEDKSSF